MKPFQLIRHPITDLSFLEHFFLDLSEVDYLDPQFFPEIPKNAAWVQVDFKMDVSLPDSFIAFEKKLTFIEKKPVVYSVEGVDTIENIGEIRELLSEQQRHHHQLDSNYFADLDTFPLDAYLKEIQEKLDCGVAAAFGIREGGERIGFAVVEEEDCSAYLLELMITSSSRGKGLGRLLLAACESWAASRGLVRLWTSLSARNQLAFGFYQKQGFITFKERYVHQLNK